MNLEKTSQLLALFSYMATLLNLHAYLAFNCLQPLIPGVALK